jgi:hypothetical protein
MTPTSPSRNGSVTDSCLVCGGPLPAGRPRTTCGNKCRQTAWRRRHQPPTPMASPPLPPPEARRPVTVYACPACDTRYLGNQYCHDCNTFCQRIGYGGTCPCCEEAVAHDELTNS